MAGRRRALLESLAVFLGLALVMGAARRAPLLDSTVLLAIAAALAALVFAYRARGQPDGLLVESAMRDAQMGFWEIDAIGAVVSLNPAAAAVIGHAPAELATLTIEHWRSLVHPDDLADLDRAIAATLAAPGTVHHQEFRLRHAAGHWVWLLSRGKAIARPGTRTRCMVGMLIDISDRKRSEMALQESENKFRTLFERSPAAMALKDLRTGRFLQVNDALLAPTGYSREELLGKTFWEMTPPQYHALEREQLALLERTARYGPFEKEYLRKDGSSFPVLVSGLRMQGPDGRELIWSIFQDMSQHKVLESQLAHSAQRDRLTGLANRALFMDRLQRAVVRVQDGQQPLFAVLFLDFDRFKLVNDTLGHQAGDELLRQISRRLQSALRASDTAVADDAGNLVSRFGGDEFLILINDLRASVDATRIAERLLKVLAPAYSILGSEVYSSASIGIVTSEQCQSSAEDVVRNADVAMYEAKRSGRACSVVFNEIMHTRLTRHVTIEAGLRKAIGSAELSVVYQPIVELSTGHMVSAEALVRWTHPVMGPISPSEFIPIAEESGLIVALGKWVLQEACQAMAAWRDRDPLRAPRTISVNVSRAELALGRHLLEQLESVLAACALPPHCLQLEVTEREVMRNPEASLKLMQELQRLGVQIAMDDFGTGTSSLGFLRDYPFNTIKIDRSFVKDLTGSGDVLAVIHATINLVENLGMASLAEGVEEPAQVAILQSLGCRYAQGYLFSRPVAADRLLDALAARPLPAHDAAVVAAEARSA